jgi:hypothetical protein
MLSLRCKSGEGVGGGFDVELFSGVYVVRWLLALLLPLTGVGRGGCGGSGGAAGETGAPSFRDDPWRIKCSSLVFVGTGIVAGFSGGFLGRYVYQLVKSGWSFAPTFSGGFLPLRGGLLAGVLGMLVVEAPDSLLSGDAMAPGHLVRPVRSAGKKHVGVAGMLLLVPFKTFEESSSGGWSASTRLFRPPAMRMTGRSL